MNLPKSAGLSDLSMLETQIMDVLEDSNQQYDLYQGWIHQHVHLFYQFFT